MADQTEDTVNVLNPSGKLVGIPASQSANAINKYGYKPATAASIDDYKEQQEYGQGTDRELEAAALGAANTASVGLVPYALSKSGLVPAKTQRSLEKYNPSATSAGNIAGFVGGMAEGPVNWIGKAGAGISGAVAPGLSKAAGLLASPETSAIANKILTGVGEHAVAGAFEAPLFSAGENLHESALGDPDVTGEKVLTDMGHSAIFGAGLGGLLGLGSGTYSGIKSKVFGDRIGSAAARDSIAENTTNIGPGMPGEIQGISTPTSMEEVARAAKQADHMGLDTSLPSKLALQKATELEGPTNFPVLPLQMESLDNPATDRLYRTIKQSDTADGMNLNKYESAQKAEGIQKIKNTVQEIAPGYHPTSDPVDGGNKLSSAFKDQYEAEQKAMIPEFEKFDKLQAASAVSAPEILQKLDSSLPGTAKYIEQGQKGYVLKPFDATLGISEDAHSQMKNIVKALNKDDLTLGGIRNVRNVIDKSTDFTTNPGVAREIGSLRKGLMDVYQDGIQKIDPSLEVRDTFKRYAINEDKRMALEDLLGGSLKGGKPPVPEKILDKLFSNTLTTQAAKDLLGSKFNEALADHLSNKISQATNEAGKGFSSNKFSTAINGKSSGPVFREALKENPALLDKLNAITDKMRILPDAPLANPSGTSSTSDFMNAIHKIGSLTQGGLGHIPSNILKTGLDQINQIRNRAAVNEILSKQVEQKAAKYTVLANMEKAAQKTTQNIQSSVKKVFDFASKSPDLGVGIAGAKLGTQEDRQKHRDKHDVVAKQLNEYQANPSLLVDNLHEATKDIYDYAPNVTGSIQMAASRATQFLASKVPRGTDTKLLSSPFVPSDTELAKFNRYHQMVEHPLLALNQLKTSSLTTETIETLQIVYPKLYGEMKSSLLGQMTNFLSKKSPTDIPYKTKMSLSMFLGQDLDNSLSQASIASNQTSLAGHGQQQANNELEQRVKTSQSGLSKLSMAHSALTDMQQTSQRERG